MATAAEQSMALKVMNQILGKKDHGKKGEKGSKQRRLEKQEAKEEEKINRAVAISQH